MQKHKITLNLIAILAILITTPGNVSMVAQAGNGNEVLKADPRLLQMAEENPDAVFMVIVQKEAKNKDLKDMEVEGEVLKGGGQVKQQLDLIVSFSAEMTGKEIKKLAKHPKVRWISADAPMISTGGPGLDTVRDDFSSISFSGNNGTKKWSGSWMEAGESDGVGSGMLRVVSDSQCAANNCMRLGMYWNRDPITVSGISLSREVNLAGAASAFLNFTYQRNARKGDVEVTLSASKDGGVSWTDLTSYPLNVSDSGQISQSFDLTQFISDKTTIRFLVSGKFPEGKNTYLYVDNLEIAFAYPSAFVSTIKANQLNLTGQGVTVAVIDSGITTLHPDFKSGGASRIIASTKFGSFLTTEDMYGHGTHVAGTIAGNGAMSGGSYRGVAPGVNLVNVKVSDDFGMTYESNLVSGLQWIYNNKDKYNIRVVNISMNSTVAQSYHTSPLAAAVEILWFNGIVVVVSAGNNGTGKGPVTLYPPANDPFVITVGATEDKGTSSLSDDKLAVFSAYGTTEHGFVKPDLVAPGRNVVAPLGGIFNIVFQLHPSHRVNNYYFRMSGTSMSAPVVSGAVALLLQDEPNLNPDQVKYRLMATANRNWSYDPAQSGAGYLDVYAAVYGTTTQSANQGVMVSQMLTTGSTPVTWGSVGWNSVGWNSVGWNSVGWNSVGWNSVGWNSVGWNSVGWNTSTWDD